MKSHFPCLDTIMFSALVVLGLLTFEAVTANAQNRPPVLNGTLKNCNGDNGQCSTTTCQTDNKGNSNCVTNTLTPPPGPPVISHREARRLACEDREREKQWVSYCSPETYIGTDGISRYRYTHASCAGGAGAPWVTKAVEETCRLESALR